MPDSSFWAVPNGLPGRPRPKKIKYEYCCHFGCIYLAQKCTPWWDLIPLWVSFIEHMGRNNAVCGRMKGWIASELIKNAATKVVTVLIFALFWPRLSTDALSRGVRRPQATMIQRPTETTSHLRTSPMTTCNKLYTSIQRCRKMSTLDAGVHVWVV